MSEFACFHCLYRYHEILYVQHCHPYRYFSYVANTNNQRFLFTYHESGDNVLYWVSKFSLTCRVVVKTLACAGSLWFRNYVGIVSTNNHEGVRRT